MYFQPSSISKTLLCVCSNRIVHFIDYKVIWYIIVTRYSINDQPSYQWRKYSYPLAYKASCKKILLTTNMSFMITIELHAPTSSTQKLKLMGRGGQFTYIPTLPFSSSSSSSSLIQRYAALLCVQEGKKLTVWRARDTTLKAWRSKHVTDDLARKWLFQIQ